MKRRRTSSQQYGRNIRMRPRYAYQNRPRQGIPATLMPSSEMKYFDSSENSRDVNQVTSQAWGTAHRLDPIDPNGPVSRQCLFWPQLGNDINSRIGKKISVLKITVRGSLQIIANTATGNLDNNPMARLLLVLNQQTNGIAMEPGELLLTGSSVGSSNLFAFQNVNFLGKHRILKDKYYRLPTVDYQLVGANVQNSGTIVNFKLSHRFRKPLVVTFNSGQNQTVADIVSNSVHLIGACNNGDLVMQASYKCRTYYKDM